MDEFGFDDHVAQARSDGSDSEDENGQKKKKLLTKEEIQKLKTVAVEDVKYNGRNVSIKIIDDDKELLEVMKAQGQVI